MEVYLERMFDLLNDRQHVAVPGASVRASSVRVDNAETTYDSNGKWVPPGKWLGAKTLPGIEAKTKEVVVENALDVVPRLIFQRELYKDCSLCWNGLRENHMVFLIKAGSRIP